MRKFLALAFLALTLEGCAKQVACYQVVTVYSPQALMIFNACTGNIELTPLPPAPKLGQGEA